MKNQLRLVSFVSAGVAAIVLGLASPAVAGRGGSASRIANATNTGSVDAIIAEVERAERLPCDACVPIVMDLLDHDRYEVREVAAWWFARRANLRVELAARATSDLAGTDSRLARNSADLLGAFMHPQAIPALTAAVGRTDLSADARAAAVRALGMIGHLNGRAGLTAALGDADVDVRLMAVTTWVQLRAQPDAAPVVARIADTDARVRAAAAGVVGSLRDASGRGALEGALASDADANVRRNAAWALGQIGDPASRPALVAATTDASALVRSTAKAALFALR
ncbi:MAG: HEAT repeat domain-containing protein [Myxococcales bacterium]|nr:HEAT repeat domain-containing protein [Myxococcales bacterium]